MLLNRPTVKAFLKGKIKKTPYHCAPVNSETIPLLADLIRVNRAGFISVCGQPALDEIKFVSTIFVVGNHLK